MNGMELLRHVRAIPELKSTPMIFLTAKSAEKDKIEAFRLGIDDYLLKPFSLEELKARVKNQLRLVKAREELKPSDEPEEAVTDQIIAKWLKEIRLITEENANKADFSLDSVAEKMGESSRTFSRKLKKHTGYSPGVYLKEIRLQLARRMLENGVHSRVNEVSQAVGFSSNKYFSRLYKERFGKYPSDYLR
jgi:transcriptional regulator GlxA family with amidase domain